MNVQLQYEYADGNGNVFLLTPSTLEFVPVTPEHSSSGTYSGGEPKKVTVTETEFDQLKGLLQKAIANKSVHQEDRQMMTGLIVTGNTRVVLKRNCVEKNDIESFLTKILNK